MINRDDLDMDFLAQRLTHQVTDNLTNKGLFPRYGSFVQCSVYDNTKINYHKYTHKYTIRIFVYGVPFNWKTEMDTLPSDDQVNDISDKVYTEYNDWLKNGKDNSGMENWKLVLNLLEKKKCDMDAKEGEGLTQKMVEVDRRHIEELKDCLTKWIRRWRSDNGYFPTDECDLAVKRMVNEFNVFFRVGVLGTSFTVDIHVTGWVEGHYDKMTFNDYACQVLVKAYEQWLLGRGNTKPKQEENLMTDTNDTPRSTNADFIEDMEYFISKLKSRGSTLTRLKQVRTLLDCELDRLENLGVDY